MKANRIYRNEQLKLIMECRQSGLSDYQWCQKHEIHPGTFYNWVSKLRKVGACIPESSSRSVAAAVTQEIVKVDLVPNEESIPTKVEQNTNVLATAMQIQPAMEILVADTTIRFYNDANPSLIETAFRSLGGIFHAW